MKPVNKYGMVIPVSRELLLDAGAVEPTAAEREERAARVAAWRAERAAARPGILEALRKLDALEGLERELLDLHAREGREYFRCEGCDFDGYEGEAPQWPCRTVDLIAHRRGIDLSGVDRYGLMET